MNWYYTMGGSRRGPVSDDVLRKLAEEGGLKPDDLVWNETMDAWASAGTVGGLFGTPPPPLPGARLGSGLPAFRPSGGISCTEPVGFAWDRMRAMLFRPFDAGKWFALGFCAWLVGVGQGGGSFNFNPGRWEHAGRSGPADLREMIEQARAFLAQYWAVISAIAVPIIVLAVALGLALMWVRARGTFMFLDNVATNRSRIAAPWRQYRRQANSLFLWKIGFGLVWLVCFVLLLGALVWGVIAPCVASRAFVPSVIPVLLVLVALWMLFALLCGYIMRFLEDFVAPIMYRFDLSAIQAWRQFTPMLKAHFWRLVLYGLFYWVLSFAAILGIALIVLATCCIAGCLIIIPYIGSVVLLPATVFFRNYSLACLAQFGPEYDVLTRAAGDGA